jgi:hypothetical protein
MDESPLGPVAHTALDSDLIKARFIEGSAIAHDRTLTVGLWPTLSVLYFPPQNTPYLGELSSPK